MEILEHEFKHSDNRRTLTQLLTADIQQVNTYHAVKGSVLGNHFHKNTTEYFYLLRGSAILKVDNNDYVMQTRGPIYRVNPGEKHTIDCLNDVMLMSFLSKPYTEKDPDIYA